MFSRLSKWSTSAKPWFPTVVNLLLYGFYQTHSDWHFFLLLWHISVFSMCFMIYISFNATCGSVSSHLTYLWKMPPATFLTFSYATTIFRDVEKPPIYFSVSACVWPRDKWNERLRLTEEMPWSLLNIKWNPQLLKPLSVCKRAGRCYLPCAPSLLNIPSASACRRCLFFINLIIILLNIDLLRKIISGWLIWAISNFHKKLVFSFKFTFHDFFRHKSDSNQLPLLM